MIHKAFVYSLKVWLTSVLANSILIFAIVFFPFHNYSNRDFLSALGDGVSIFLTFVFVELIFSFFTWIIFSLLIMLTFKFSLGLLKRKWLAFFIGMALTVLTFALFTLFFFGGFGWSDSFLSSIMLFNCICVGCSIWCYNLNPTESVIDA